MHQSIMENPEDRGGVAPLFFCDSGVRSRRIYYFFCHTSSTFGRRKDEYAPHYYCCIPCLFFFSPVC